MNIFLYRAIGSVNKKWRYLASLNIFYCRASDEFMPYKGCMGLLLLLLFRSNRILFNEQCKNYRSSKGRRVHDLFANLGPGCSSLGQHQRVAQHLGSNCCRPDDYFPANRQLHPLKCSGPAKPSSGHVQKALLKKIRVE